MTQRMAAHYDEGPINKDSRKIASKQQHAGTEKSASNKEGKGETISNISHSYSCQQAAQGDIATSYESLGH